MKNRAIALAALACSCSGSGGLTLDADSLGGPEILPPGCEGKALPATTLLCTGLYLDIATKQLAPGVEPYSPAIALWSDGAEKDRWIRLPPGTTIDNSDPTEWVFPVGTKLWKQFVKEGRRVETRLWQKVRDRFWVDAAYAWNEDESAAVQTGGGDIPFGNGVYHIPKQDECEKCHRGRNEHILGFEQVELGLPGATGLTLPRLAAEGRLSTPPSAEPLAIGDDGTGAAAPALGWLHANCGITCHNSNSNSTGYGAGMDLRMDSRRLDGQSVAGFDSLRTTVGVTVNTPAWTNRTRIVAGDPTASLLYELISNRGMGKQMPPIATSEVDVTHVALVAEWIRRMAPGPGPVDPDPVMPDAGIPDAAVPDAAEPDAAVVPPDAAEPDAAVVPPDAAEPDAPEPDAGVPDAPPPDEGTPDAGAPDAPPEDSQPDAGAPDADGEETAVAPDAGPDDLAPAL
jgi:hypothetical protein